MQLPRDSKYFQNKNYDKFSEYLPILETYKEFLIINKGFVASKYNTDIKLPSIIKTENAEV